MPAIIGSAEVQGRLWGERASDSTLIELVELYSAALSELGITRGTRLLDVGCGAGLFLRMAAQRGAVVAGIDAAEPLIEIARERVPDADLTVGEMEALPHRSDSFDVVTGFNAFQLAADPGKALREAGRVGRPGAPVLIAAWGRRDECEAAAYIAAMRALAPSGTPGPFALSEPGALETFAAGGGLITGERRHVPCVWSFPDQQTLLRALKSTSFAVKAIAVAGEDAVEEAILAAAAPYRTSVGGYRIENVFTYVIATA
jgi:SAM-dependent methyltransferase